MSRGAGGHNGFTFVELLIAATMMSVLFVGLGSHLRGGMLVWRRATATADAVQRERVGFDRMEHDLANAFAYGTSEGAPAAVFGEHELTVVTLQPVPAQGRRVRVVTYRCGNTEDAQGVLRMSESVGQLRAGLAPTPQLLLPDCEALSLRYAYQSSTGTTPLEWNARWLYPDELPRFVEVRVQLHSGRTMHHVLGIPIGALKPLTAEAG